MGTLIFDNTGTEREIPDGGMIQDVCEEEGVPFACAEGVCGTCVVEVIEGKENLSEWTQEERDFFGPPLQKGPCERLACQCRLKSGVTRVRF